MDDTARAPRTKIKSCRNKECRMKFYFLEEQVEIARIEAILALPLTGSSMLIGSWRSAPRQLCRFYSRECHFEHHRIVHGWFK